MVERGGRACCDIGVSEAVCMAIKDDCTVPVHRGYRSRVWATASSGCFRLQD